MKRVSPPIKFLAPVLALSAGPAWGHAAEGGFVLLLPTGVYIAAGVASVAATVLLLALLPPRAVDRLFRPVPLIPVAGRRLAAATSLAAALILAALVWIGLNGPRDPLTNLIPLAVWTIWWIALVSVQGVLGGLWRWIDPLAAPLALARRAGLGPAPLRLPRRLGRWPGVVLFLGFAAFLLADIAPADPARLAMIAGGYWLAAFLAALAFGPRWRVTGEPFTMLMRAYGKAGLFGPRGARLAAGLPGWRILRGPAPGTAGAVFALLLLGTGSFDGLNETFWWFAQIGINPLEFPGRSEVAAETLAGLLGANLALVAAFALAVRLGLALAGGGAFGPAFCAFAPTILPIALGYHIAHYLPGFLVDAQWAVAALSDPLARGDDLLGLGSFYVTTGFFNTESTVRAIWLTQAGAVVTGHVVAILLAHGIAVRRFPGRRAALLSQAPLALFMVLYTLFGLWLLASPRGV